MLKNNNEEKSSSRMIDRGASVFSSSLNLRGKKEQCLAASLLTTSRDDDIEGPVMLAGSVEGTAGRINR